MWISVIAEEAAFLWMVCNIGKNNVSIFNVPCHELQQIHDYMKPNLQGLTAFYTYLHHTFI